MPVPTSIAAISTSAASNSPSGSDSIGTALDDYLRATQAIIKQNVSKGTDIVSSSAITIPNAGSYFIVTGSTTINSIVDSWVGRTVCLEFSGTPQLTYSSGLLVSTGVNYTVTAGDIVLATNKATGVWKLSIVRNGRVVVAPEIQSQAFQAFTTAGTSTAYTLTPSPATTANAANQRFRVKFNSAAGTTPTLAVSGQAALSLKYYDSTGTKSAITSALVPANWVSDVECDGTDWVVLQTVQSSSLFLPSQTGKSGASLITNGTTESWGSGITVGTAVASTSGTDINFTTIPSWANQITLLLSGVSGATSAWELGVQLGDSGGFETTGYVGTAGRGSSSGYTVVASSTTYASLFGAQIAAADTVRGEIVITRMSATAWIMKSILSASNTTIQTGVCEKTLSGDLTQVRVKMIGGSAFDAGSITPVFE